MITDINSEDRLVQQTFAGHLEKLGWESAYTYNAETFGPAGTLRRASERDVVLVRDLRAAFARLNPEIPEAAREQAIEKLTRIDYARSLLQHNRADYNREKDRATVEATFAQLVELAAALDAEQRRAAEEGLTDTEPALFDLLFKESISKTERGRLKQASRSLLSSLQELLRPMQGWTQKTATQAEVKVFILDSLFGALPRPPFTDGETEEIAGRVYDYVWQRSASGHDLLAA